MATVRFALFWSSMLALALAVGAQETGTVLGLVVDAETGESMLGVSVMLEGTTMGAASDLDGTYRIRNVAAGTYTLVANYIGYSRISITGVAVTAGQETVLNFQMNSEALELGEVVIESRLMNNTEASLLSIQKKAPALSDGISAEQIKRSPDSDAADAVKRVTGITVVGDKYVFVRGMGERYNNTRLNGTTIASPEPLKRTVPFDIISANLLDNIVVSKTATPDQPADFGGGSVQLTTKEFPEKLTFQISTTSAYNDQSSFRDFNTYSGGNRDWIGVDDDARAIPDRVLAMTADSLWQTNTPLRRELAKEFSNTWEPRRKSAPMNVSRNVSVGNQTAMLGKPLGYLLSLTYSDSYHRRQERQFAYTARTDPAEGIVVEPYEDYNVDRSTRSVTWGGILDLNTKLSPTHKLSLKSMYNRSADDEVRITQGFGGDGELFRNYRLAWTERSLLTSQLKGSHEIGPPLNSRVEWTGSYSKATYDQPDRRDVAYIFNDDEAVNAWEFWASTTSGYRRFAEMDDDVVEGQADWSIPLKLFGDPSSKLKFGGLVRHMDRQFPTRKFQMRYDREPGTDAMTFTLPPEVIYSPESIEKYFVLSEITSTLDSYEATMDVTAGYLMADILFGRRWRAVGGVRVEQTNQHFRTFPYPGSTSPDNIEGGPEHTDVLPSLNLTYKVSEKMNLRAAGSGTIANPDYAEIVPTEDNDYFDGGAKWGNPNVKYTRILNGDLRAELYPSPGENLSVGLFVKEIKDPIEHILVPNGASVILRPDNLVDATNIGGEIEFRKSFDFLAGRVGDWSQYFSVIGNVTLISSEVKLKGQAYSIENPQGALTSSKRPMMGQSDYVINGTVAFDQPRWGTSVRLLFNTFGERISRVGGYGIPDTYEQPFARLDLAYNQRLSAYWSVKFQAVNILNPEVKYLTGQEPLATYKLGRTIAAGITYSL